VTAADARSVLLLLNGDIRHSRDAGLSSGEVASLALRSWGLDERFIAGRLKTHPCSVRAMLEAGRGKLIKWHRQQARAVLAPCENRRVQERPTYEDPRTGEQVELRSTQSAEDEKARIHPDVRPTARQLTAKVERALRVVTEG
jgi:hypothetical protein